MFAIIETIHLATLKCKIRTVDEAVSVFLGNNATLYAIAAISSEGVLATELMTGTVNGDHFYGFLRGTLIPIMQPFEFTFSDNCSVHHVSEVRQLFRSTGIFLLPYSPDLN